MKVTRGKSTMRWGAMVISVLVAGLCRADLPGLRAPLPTEPNTLSEFRNRLPGSATTGLAIDDAEIQELARGLRYDPNLMYKFVHDHIEFTPMWGEVKGPYMTWMDRSGTAFDQASLLIALLTHAANAQEAPCTITNIKYVVGEITVTSEQFCSWFGGVWPDPNIARKLLARGGFYGEVSEDGSGEIDSVKLVHVWVKATIGGQTYQFDPSFKSHAFANSRFSPGVVTQFNVWDFMAAAEPNTGVWDKATIRSDLTTYTTRLINYIQTNYPSDDIRDMIGTKNIIPVTLTALPPLPYTVDYTRQEFALGSIPSIYRTTLRIQHHGIDQTLYSSDIYGRRLSLQYNGSHQPQLILDGTVKATGNATTPGTAYDLILTVDHPYENTRFDGAVTLQVRAGGFYHVVNGWGDTGTKILLKHRQQLQEYRLTLADSDEEVLGESYALVGLTYLAKTSLMRNLASLLWGSGHSPYALVNHHLLGITGQYDAPYLDMALGHVGFTCRFSSENDGVSGVFYALAGHASAYEEEVIRQIQDCNAVSTPRLLEMAIDRPTYNQIFTATSANWSSVQTQLVNWSQGEKDRVTAYINAGFSVDLPQYGDLTQTGWDWTGMGFRAIRSTDDLLAAAYVVGGYKGATGCDSATLSPAALLGNCLGSASDGDPEGAYGSGATDIAIGHGGLPFGLAFGRQYSSHRRSKDGPLGLGWTHNYDITAKVLSDSFQALASESAANCAPQIVSLYVANSVLSYSDRQTTANLCETWLIDQMKDNVVDIRQGSSLLRFTKDATGDYTPPRGQALKLTKAGGNYRLKNSKGIFYDFDSSGKLDTWSDAHGNVVDFSYSGGKLGSVASKIGGTTSSWALSFTYTGDRITSVTDSASRNISYTYTGNGELRTYRNPDGNDVTYEYDATNKGLLRKIYSPIDDVNAVVTVVYDAAGRVKQQIDANDCTWDFYRATYRNEVLPPEQTDPNGVTKRFGAWSWVNPPNRTVTSKDVLGRTTTSIYDAHGRSETVISPSGMSGEYWYDENHNVLIAESLSIPGSDDPNVWAEYGYCTAVSQAGRWFVHRKEQSDVTGATTYYYYDYNDVGTYGTELGRLMKVVGPPADAGRAVVQYAYNSYGQMETQTDPNGMITKFEYYTAAQGGGLKKTIVDHGGGKLNLTTEVTYDSVGRVATVTDPRGNTATNQYSAGGRLLKTISPAPFHYERTYEYYADGKLRYVKQESVSGANNFANDPNCVSVWRLEPGTLTADSKGTNTLTNQGVTSQTADCREGSGCGLFVRSEGDHLYRTDSNLSSKFPLKTGDTNKRISVSAWVKLNSLPSSGAGFNVWSKANGASSPKKWCLQLGVFNLDGTPKFSVTHGYNNGASYEMIWWTAGAPVAGRWYFVVYTYQDSDRSYRLHVWDATNNQRLGGAGSDVTGTTANPISVVNARWCIGSREDPQYMCWNGLIDEVAVFNDVLTAGEIDQIRQGSYGSQTIVLQDITYNQRGQKATTRGPYPASYTQAEYAVNYTQYAYDALGRLRQVTDAEGNITTTRYYPDGKVWRVIDAEDHNSVTNRYYGHGALKEVEDAKGNITRYEYNGFMGLARTIYPNRSEPNDNYEERGYDEYRRPSWVRGRSGQLIEFEYDDLSRVRRKTTKGPYYGCSMITFNVITYEYDLLGRLYRTTDKTGTTTNVYDRVGRLVRVEYPDDKTVAYQYDACGNRTRLTYPDGTYITYEYDQLNRLTCVKNQAGTALASYSYDSRSRRTGLDYLNGAYGDYSYDAASRLLALDNRTNNGQYKYAYTYDDVGNRVTMAVTDNSGTRMHVYSYDKIYQITDVNYPAELAYLATDTQFSYDPAGNRISVIDGAGTCTYTTNHLNQYTAAGAVGFTYDDSGNLTRDENYLYYAYDPENRLLEVRRPNPATQQLNSFAAYTKGGDAPWVADPYGFARSGAIDDDQESWMYIDVQGAGTVQFDWK
ncbi:MAG: hypothetical protein FJ280_16625, partial [Planctomycetes bacterium]|nr:hypothetical protein [Planctomycetota bacterium]